MSSTLFKTILTSFSHKLKYYREKRELTQEKLSELSGVDRGYISGCESATKNPSLDIISKLAYALRIDIVDLFDISLINNNLNLSAPIVKEECFREVPLPLGLTMEEVHNAMQQTQDFFCLIRKESGINLSEIIQGNNFSGVLSNVFTRKISDCSCYKEYSTQRYPDLMGPQDVGLEVKASINAWKGGEGHNGHSGWHIIGCYRIIDDGNIEFTQIEIANLIGYGLENSDWKYQGSSRNSNNSQRTETYVTTKIGTAKLRDGTLYWRSDLAPLHSTMINNRKKLILLPIPPFSPFF